MIHNYSTTLLAVAAIASTNPLFSQDNAQAVLLHLENDVRQVRVEAMDVDSGRWLAIASGYREAVDSGWLKIPLPEEYASAELRVLSNTAPSPFAGKVQDPAVPGELYVASPPSSGVWAYMTEDSAANKRSEDPVIEEADIWAWEGNTLFFYNQYRGLQVIDMAVPEEPQWLDYFRYPAKGEDLYAVGDGRIILVGTGSYWSGDKVTLQFIDFDGTALSGAETVELEAGQYMDSRRYNDYLYVMTREWVQETNPEGQLSRAPFIRLYTIALSDTASERVIDVQSFEGDGWLDAVLNAQPDGILLSLNKWYDRTTDWRFRWRSEVHVLVPGEDGILSEVGVAPLAGVVQDKYKMNFADGLLTTISQQADWSTGQFTRATKLENFSLGDGGFTKIGSLDLAPGETLFASRFYGDTVYIVTFLFVDPLFSIDNSNPSHPVIAGELEVPGWSNYIEWVEGYLFAVGIEERQLTVSIFDVADPANMSLKDRVFLSEDSWAWSEAQYDDQAISFFPDAGMLMLPFTTWSWSSSERIQAMQLITWDETGLQLRGQVQHIDVPRRGVLMDNTVITISGREVVATDVTDPDVPVEGGAATLAWNVQHLIPNGDYWLQLESEESGYYFWRVPYNPAVVPDPILYVTARDAPNVPLAEVSLAAGRLLGVAHMVDRLILLQDISEGPKPDYWQMPEKQSLAVRAYDISNPLEPVLLDEALLNDVPYLGGSFESNMTGDGAIVWTSNVQQAYVYWAIDIWPGPWFYPSNLSYLVSTIGAAGEVAIPAHAVYPTEDFWNYASGWFWENPLLVSSMTTYIERERPDTYPDYKAQTELIAVDFSEPSEPVQYPKTEIPSHMVAIEPVQDGLNHYLYFEPQWNMVEVWGWDQASAFSLFRQKLYPDDTQNSYAYSFAWMAPFHLRSRYNYNNGQYTNHLDVWHHQFDENRFKTTEAFTYDNEWFGSWAVREPEFLLSVRDRVEIFHGDAISGTFLKTQQLDLEFPNIYSLNLDEAVLQPEALYVPVGIYGVETLPITLAVPAEARYLAGGSSASGEWQVMDSTAWQLVGKTSTDAAGAVHGLQWLFHPDTMREIDNNATDAGDFWRESGWFGWYAHSLQDPAWLHHLEHGALYAVVDDNPETNGVYLWDDEIGFVWTQANTYPHLYAYDRDQWLYYLSGSGIDAVRWFYDYGSGWFSLDR
ncbi:MAG: beta-propeller domain-containing protein [Puniceicoccaceae bacterium]